MLIAMMANTYTKSYGHSVEWVRQWAKMILSIEQNVNIKQRIKEQKKYSYLMASGQRDLIVKWKMNVSLTVSLPFNYQKS